MLFFGRGWGGVGGYYAVGDNTRNTCMHACGMAVWPHLHTTATHCTVVDNWPYRNQRVGISPVQLSSGRITPLRRQIFDSS